MYSTLNQPLNCPINGIHLSSYQTYDIHKNKNDFEVHEAMPEYYEGVRAKPPEDTIVLIGYCKSPKHYDWIQKQGMYNFRVTGRGALDPKQFSADYLLLHTEGNLITNHIKRIIKTEEGGPKRLSNAEMKALSYPDPTQEEYFVYQITPAIEENFAGAEWDIRNLKGFKKGRGSVIPFAVSLTDLMRVKLK